MNPPGLVLAPGKPPLVPGKGLCGGKWLCPVVEPDVVDPVPDVPVVVTTAVFVLVVVPVGVVMTVVDPVLMPVTVDDEPPDVAPGQVHGQNQAAWFGWTVHVSGVHRSDSTQTLVGAEVGACVTKDAHVQGQYAFDAGY